MALAFAAAAIALLALRPPRVPEWIWPVAGALLLVFIGAEPVRSALGSIAAQWNVLLFILGLMLISATAEESGTFAWIADLALHQARGSRRRLFVLMFTACAVVTALLSNDATAIALTPIVYQTVSKRAGNDTTPFLYGCVFAANTASFGLPFSNPANVLILPRPHLPAYVWHLGPPEIIAIAVNLALMLFFFRRQLQGSYAPVDLQPASARILRTLLALGTVVVAYVAALLLNWPLGPVALAGAGVTLALAYVSPNRLWSKVSWPTFALLAGLFVLLDAVARAGFVGWSVSELDRLLRYGNQIVGAAAAVGAAIASNVFNNLPVAVAASYVVSHVSSQHVAYPLIAGVALGPNLLTTGSLATILWLAVLRDRGIRMSARTYARLGAVITPATLGVVMIWLWLAR